jgi:hypothetical protein
MRRRVGIAVALTALTLSGVAFGQGAMNEKDGLRIRFDADFAPHALPRERAAPVTVSIEGEVSTTDGSHPPPLEFFEIELNRNGRLSTVGLPICRAAELQSTNSQTALARCRGAKVGHGRFGADLPTDDAAIPTRGRILAFNTRVKGRPALLLHLYGTVPIQATFVLPLEIRHQAKGPFGTLLATKVPKLAGGVGAITDIDLELGREYTYRGVRRGYLSASCAAPAGFSRVPFAFARGTFRFADGRSLDAPLGGECRVRG